MGKYDEGKFAVPPSLSLGDAMNFAHGVWVAEATEKLSQEIAQLRKEKEHLGNLLEQSWKAGADSIREVERLKHENESLEAVIINYEREKECYECGLSSMACECGE